MGCDDWDIRRRELMATTEDEERAIYDIPPYDCDPRDLKTWDELKPWEKPIRRSTYYHW